MTKGELIVASIKIMFDNGDVQLDSTDISNNLDYEDRTKNIIESINRGLHRVHSAGKIPNKYFTIDKTTSISLQTRQYSRYDLSKLISDYYLISSVAIEDDYGYSNNVEYRLENNIIVLPKITNSNVDYIISYMPKVKEISYKMNDTEVLDYPDEILNIIPYFVKADLYEDDDIASARYSRNIFEQYLSALPNPSESSTNREILSVYSW